MSELNIAVEDFDASWIEDKRAYQGADELSQLSRRPRDGGQGPRTEDTKKRYTRVFHEVCFLQRIRPDQAVRYEEFLIQRRKDIEETISSHFELLHDTLKGMLKDALKKRRAKREAMQVLSLA